MTAQLILIALMLLSATVYILMFLRACKINSYRQKWLHSLKRWDVVQYRGKKYFFYARENQTIVLASISDVEVIFQAAQPYKIDAVKP